MLTPFHDFICNIYIMFEVFIHFLSISKQIVNSIENWYFALFELDFYVEMVCKPDRLHSSSFSPKAFSYPKEPEINTKNG